MARRYLYPILITSMALLLLSSPALAQHQDLLFDLDRPSFTIDITANRSADHVAAFSGNLTVDVDYSTTVYLSAQAGDWETAITPTDKYVLPGETAIYFSGLCEVPDAAPDGRRNLIISAQGEDPAGTPFIEQVSIPITVIQNRVAVEAHGGEIELGQTGNASFNIQVRNRGTTLDTFRLKWAGEGVSG